MKNNRKELLHAALISVSIVPAPLPYPRSSGLYFARRSFFRLSRRALHRAFIRESFGRWHWESLCAALVSAREATALFREELARRKKKRRWGDWGCDAEKLFTSHRGRKTGRKSFRSRFPIGGSRQDRELAAVCACASAAASTVGFNSQLFEYIRWPYLSNSSLIHLWEFDT